MAYPPHIRKALDNLEIAVTAIETASERLGSGRKPENTDIVERFKQLETGLEQVAQELRNTIDTRNQQTTTEKADSSLEGTPKHA